MATLKAEIAAVLKKARRHRGAGLRLHSVDLTGAIVAVYHGRMVLVGMASEGVIPFIPTSLVGMKTEPQLGLRSEVMAWRRALLEFKD